MTLLPPTGETLKTSEQERKKEYSLTKQMCARLCAQEKLLPPNGHVQRGETVWFDRGTWFPSSLLGMESKRKTLAAAMTRERDQRAVESVLKGNISSEGHCGERERAIASRQMVLSTGEMQMKIK